MAGYDEREALAAELTNIRHALDRSAIVAITDRAGNITHVNDKFCEISKYSREELIGRNHRIINSGYHPKEFFVDLWKTISSGQIWVGEIKNKAKDQNYYWVHTTIVPFLDPNGLPHKYVSIRFEITQRKQAEEQLRVYTEKLEASNQELERFASIAAHDLQEPLRKIRTFSEYLSARCRSNLAEESQEYLNRIEKSAKRMSTLIEDLLAYSRITTQQRPFVSIDLKNILAEVLSDLEIRIEQTKARIEVGDLPVVRADPVQLRQLFQNLIANSLKFRKMDVPVVVKIQAQRLSNVIELTVSDNGIGFDEIYLDKIFSIFERLHGKDEYEGTGVGLAICRRIVERHGGQLTAKSRVGEGAAFIARLPDTLVE